MWGFNKLERIDAVQNRAIRLFLGVHRFAPNKAISADMGWVSSRVRRHVSILRLWNRLVSMNPDRLTNKIFIWDETKRGWSKNVKQIMSDINCLGGFELNGTIDLTYARNSLYNLECVNWTHDVIKVPKLRTYIFYFIKQNTPRNHMLLRLTIVATDRL